MRNDRIVKVVLLRRGNRPLKCIGCKSGRMMIRYRTIERFETVCCRRRVYPDAATLIQLLPSTEDKI